MKDASGVTLYKVKNQFIISCTHTFIVGKISLVLGQDEAKVLSY